MELNNSRIPTENERLWSLSAINNHFQVQRKWGKHIGRLHSIPNLTVISLWKLGYRIFIKPVRVWKKTTVKVRNEQRMRFVIEDTLVPDLKYHMEIVKLDDSEIKRGRKEGIPGRKTYE